MKNFTKIAKMLTLAGTLMLAGTLQIMAEKTQTLEEFAATTKWPVGDFNSAYAQFFIGKSYLARIDAENGGPTNVTFEPACRNNWHVHHEQVQVLICVAGEGWYQEWGKPAQKLVPGVVIAVPEGVKHWHGAAANSWMQHLTYHTHLGANPSNEWLEPVDDEAYSAVESAGTENAGTPSENSR